MPPIVISPCLKFEVIDLTITKKTLGPGTIERTNIVTNIVAALLKLIEIIARENPTPPS